MSYTAVVEIEKPKSEERFRIRHIPRLLIDTAKCWLADDPWRLSAVVAYYAVLSLPGLMVIIINLVGSIWGNDIVQGNLNSEIESALGADAAKSVQDMVANTTDGKKNLFSTIVGIGVLIFGATGVFYQLQISINKIWGLRTDPDANWVKTLFDRARSFAFILVIGFLLMVSLIVSTAVSLLSDYIQSFFPDFSVLLAYALNFALSVGSITLLFSFIFKYMPDAVIQWRTVWIGAFITALLFVIGKFLLSLYFGYSNPGSTYGAAGSIVLILLWVSYSCMILLFGVEFTWVFANRYGHGVRPKSHAMLIKEEQVVVERGTDQPKRGG